MILDKDIFAIGTVLKPHGIKGELNAELDFDINLSDLRCVIFEVEGIYVPFFLDGLRDKSVTTILIHLDGINDENHARQFQGKIIYALKKEIDSMLLTDDEDNIYLEDLINFDIYCDTKKIGKLVDYDDSTENVLLMVQPENSSSATIYLPFVDEFIADIDKENKTIVMELPDGLLEL